MTTRAPDGMSSVDAFIALYKNAKAFRTGRFNLPAEEVPPWNAIQIFKTYCPGGYCDYVRGEYLKVNFDGFPDMTTARYDKVYGDKAAEKAMQSYLKTMDKPDPKESFDLHCKPCTFFTPFWKQKTPVHQRRDLEEMFNKCERLEAEDKRAEAQINKATPSVVFDECKARYSLESPPVSYIGFDYMPCQTALDHFKDLLRHGYADDVVGLSVCRYNRYFPFLQKCQTQSSEVSLETARKILESQTFKA